MKTDAKSLLPLWSLFKLKNPGPSFLPDGIAVYPSSCPRLQYIITLEFYETRILRHVIFTPLQTASAKLENNSGLISTLLQPTQNEQSLNPELFPLTSVFRAW
jgi:hypothetical protein